MNTDIRSRKGCTGMAYIIFSLTPAYNFAQDLSQCVNLAEESLHAHIEDMQYEGWHAVNAENDLRNFGCMDSKELACLHDYTDAENGGADNNWSTKASGTLRIMHRFDPSGIDWITTSPDGRFVAGGNSDPEFTSRFVLNLATGDRREIEGDSQLVFNPDGKIFSGRDKIFWSCLDSVLYESIEAIDYLGNRECGDRNAPRPYDPVSRFSVQSDGVGNFIDILSDYTPPSNSYVSLHIADEPLAGPDAIFEYHPAIAVSNTEIKFGSKISQSTPYENGWAVSPSRKLLVSRISNADQSQQMGYRIRIVGAPTSATGNVSPAEVGLICLAGNKPTISFDERYMAISHFTTIDDWLEHGYPSKEDEQFKALVGNTSNIWIADMKSGKSHRITNMQSGQIAKSPAFRSDGWLYFLVDDRIHEKQYLVASDAMLHQVDD